MAGTSERAHLSDPRARKLADGFIESQRREIDGMKALMPASVYGMRFADGNQTSMRRRIGDN